MSSLCLSSKSRWRLVMQKWSWTLKEGMGLPEIGESGCSGAGAQVLGVSVHGFCALCFPGPRLPSHCPGFPQLFQVPRLRSVGQWGRKLRAFHFPDIWHPGFLPQGWAPAPGAVIRGSPEWPAGPCVPLIPTLSCSVADAAVWTSTDSGRSSQREEATVLVGRKNRGLGHREDGSLSPGPPHPGHGHDKST